MKPYLVFNNGTISASGSQVFTGFDSTEVVLVINILNAPTGTSPTLQFTIQEVDPVNQTTTLGSSATSTVINSATATTIQIPNSVSNTINVSWTLGGSASPTFTGVNVTLAQKIGGGTVTTAQGAPNTIANAWPTEITDGTHGPVTVTVSNALKIDGSAVTQPISGTVTANIGTTNGLALDTSVNGILISQGSATSGEKGPIVQGAVTTAAPSYTTAQTSPLSLTTAGALRIDGSAVTQPVSGTVTANQGGAPWSQNITQFGGANISTGTGASGAGIPRITVSNDSNILATQSGTWTVAQGVPNTTANSWPTTITDGTHGPAAVKAANTAAVKADPALVVALSPNNPITVTGQPTPIQTNVTLTSNGLLIVSVNMHDVPVNIVYYVAGPVTGTTPALTFTCVDIDPQTNTVTSLTASSGPTLTAATTPGFFTHITRTGTFQLSWTITGTTPSFGGVYTTAVPRNEGGIGLSGYTVPGDTHSVGGKDPNGNLQPISLAAEQSQYVTIAPNRQVVQTNATVTTSSSSVFNGYGDKEISLFLNIKNAPTGTTPTLTYTIQEVDPGDQTTVLGTSTTGAAITAAGTQILTLLATQSGVIKVSWVIGGSASPTFTGVYATLVTKLPGVMLGVDSTGVQHPFLTDSSGNLKTNIAPVTGGQISFGDVSIATNNTTAAVRRTTYTEQTSNFTGSVVSSSASDTAAGTGARTLTITYLDSTGAGPNTEVVTLNGITAVNLVNANHCYIEKMIITTVGTGGVNAGTITLFTGAAGGGTNVGTINAGDNRTFWAHHYTPSGKTTFITGSLIANSSTTVGAGATYALKSIILNAAHQVEFQVGDTLTLYGQSSMTPRPYTTAIPLAVGPSRTTMYVTTISATSQTYRSSFDFYDQ
jgi:hypothetical protein